MWEAFHGVPHTPSFADKRALVNRDPCLGVADILKGVETPPTQK